MLPKRAIRNLLPAKSSVRTGGSSASSGGPPPTYQKREGMQKNLLTRAQDNFWYWYTAWAHRDFQPPSYEMDYARTLANYAFLHGAKWCTSQQGKLSPFISQFIEMMVLLGWFDDDGYRIPVPLPDIEPPY